MAGAVDDRDGARFDVTTLWVSRYIDRVRAHVHNPFLASALTFGLLPSLCLLLYVALRWEHLTPGFVFSMGLHVVVLLVAPYLIWYYDRRLFPQFCQQFQEALRTETVLDDVARKYQTLYTDWWWVAAALAAIPIPLLTWFGRAFFRTRGLFGLGDPLFWLVEAVLLWIAVLVGIGFLLVLVTLLVVRQVAEEDLYIDPLHPDGLGGMSTVGYFTIRTTVLFSLGALLIPLQLQFAAATGAWATALVYAMSGTYAVAIALSFLYPTVKINRRADRLRGEVLDELRRQYREIKRTAAEPDVGATVDETDPAVEQKLRRVREEYQDYREVRLYPLELSILVRLLGSVVLPLLFIFVDTLLRPEVVEYLLGGLG